MNAFGHDCTLMIASAAGDASNVDHFTAGETVAEWRLVPNDNNIGQRMVISIEKGIAFLSSKGTKQHSQMNAAKGDVRLWELASEWLIVPG